LVLLPEHLGEIEGTFDGLIPELRLERKFYLSTTSVYGWELEEVASNNNLVGVRYSVQMFYSF